MLAHQVCDDSYSRHYEEEVTELGTWVDTVTVQVEQTVQDDGRQHNCDRHTRPAGRIMRQGYTRVGGRCLAQCKAADSACDRVAARRARAHVSLLSVVRMHANTAQCWCLLCSSHGAIPAG